MKAEKSLVFVLCDNGSVMPHDLPLPSGIADRVARNELRLVNADGTAIDEADGKEQAPKEPARKARKTQSAAE